jgi:hypothetical protein
VLLSPCTDSTPVPGLVSADDIDGDGDALDKSGMAGEDDMVTTTPGCFFLLGCFCDTAGVLLEAVLLLAVELTLILTLRAEDDRRWSPSLWRSLFERETRGRSKSPRLSSGLLGLRSDMLRDAKDGGCLLRGMDTAGSRQSRVTGAYIAIVIAPGRGRGIGQEGRQREVIRMRGTGYSGKYIPADPISDQQDTFRSALLSACMTSMSRFLRIRCR